MKWGRAPSFWSHEGPLARLLSPLSPVVAGATARRVARLGWRAPVPVICCGNATIGGSGKTPVVQDLAQRLPGAHILTRGYGGDAKRLKRVQPSDPFVLVGDEALLHAQIAPTWRCADRAEAARAAIAAGAQVLIMDDGLQNPTLMKTASLLVIDGGSGFGNGRVLPAGPLREPVAAAAARCCAAVLIGQDETNALRHLPPTLPVLYANLVQDEVASALAGRRIVAFAGIGQPDKFFQPLRAAGAAMVDARPFPDHYPYRSADCAALLRRAEKENAVLVTTPKDAVRLPDGFRQRVVVVGVRLSWRDEKALHKLLDKVIERLP